MDDSGCGETYDSHAWDWVGTEHVCTRCGVIELAGHRLARDIVKRLNAVGIRVVDDESI